MFDKQFIFKNKNWLLSTMHKTIEYSSIMHTFFFIVQMFCQLNVLLFFNVSTQTLLQKKLFYFSRIRWSIWNECDAMATVENIKVHNFKKIV